MNRALWIARKNHLWCLIKKVSDFHGGDDIDWLKEHYKEVLDAYPDRSIEEAIDCCEKMIRELKYFKEVERR